MFLNALQSACDQITAKGGCNIYTLPQPGHGELPSQDLRVILACTTRAGGAPLVDARLSDGPPEVGMRL